MPRFVPGEGSPNAKLLILGEAPGRQEDEQGRPFVGPAGMILNKWLYANNLSRDEVYITNVVKFRPPNNDFSRLSEIGIDLSTSIEDLWREIRAIGPNVILACGEKALRAVTDKKGISKWRGSILPSSYNFPKVVPTYHPSFFQYFDNSYSEENKNNQKAKYAYFHICQNIDIPRAIEESLTKDFNFPPRLIHYADNAYQVLQFFERFKDKTRAAVDIETLHQAPTCVGIAFNKYEGFSIPLINKHKDVKISNITNSDLLQVWRMVDEFLRNEKIEKIGQNFKFDREKLEDVGFRIHGKIHDLMLLGHTIMPEYPSKKQEFWTSVYTREPYYKDEYKEFDPKKQKYTDILLYNAKDAVVEFEVFEEMWSEIQEEPIIFNFYNTFVQRLHQFYYDIEKVGFTLDKEIQKELIEKYSKEVKEAELELFSIVGHEYNLNSPKQVAEVFYGELKIPKRKDTSEDTFIALLANKVTNSIHRKAIELQLSIRRQRKSISTYLQTKPDYDGSTIRTSYNIVGTETGRSSTTKPDIPLRPEAIGLPFQTITKRGIGKDIRRMLLPHPNHVLVELDYKGAEAWITALLAEDYDLLELMRAGVDVHKLTASWFFGKKLGDCTVKEALRLAKSNDPLINMSDVSKEERFIGKTGRHGGNYGEGKHTLMTTIMTEAKRSNIDVRVSEWRCGEILKTFHKFSPNIEDVFQKQIMEAVDRNKTLYNPFGRRRIFLGRDDAALYREAFATIPQGTVPDTLRFAAMRAQERLPDIRYIIESHDSITLMSPIDKWQEQTKVVKDEMEKSINFTLCSLPRGDLSIPVEVILYDKGSWYNGSEVII